MVLISFREPYASGEQGSNQTDNCFNNQDLFAYSIVYSSHRQAHYSVTALSIPQLYTEVFPSLLGDQQQHSPLNLWGLSLHWV